MTLDDFPISNKILVCRDNGFLNVRIWALVTLGAVSTIYAEQCAGSSNQGNVLPILQSQRLLWSSPHIVIMTLNTYKSLYSR